MPLLRTIRHRLVGRGPEGRSMRGVAPRALSTLPEGWGRLVALGDGQARKDARPRPTTTASAVHRTVAHPNCCCCAHACINCLMIVA